MLSVRTSRTRLGLVAVAAALSLAACGTSDGGTAAPAASASTAQVAGVDATHNDVDVTFINDMYPHHTGAIAMAELAATRAGSADVKALAEKIAGAQGPEQASMEAMAKAWGVPVPAKDMAAGHDMGGSMSGSMDDDVKALEPLKGAAFDREFLTRMTAHHEGALPMAKAELDGGENAQAKELAQSITEAQTAEIAEMKQLLAAL